MIAVDTSTTLAYWGGERGDDVVALDSAISEKRVVLPPVVVTELLSGRRTASEVEAVLADFPTLDILPGYWERAGIVRQKILARGLKARLADALITQACIDHDVPLLTRDTDFRHYAKHCGLKLA